MATTVSYVGNNFSIPAYNDTGYAQGSGNLSSYLIALATGSLTLSGGSFPLTADANFGTNFGLVALYYKSTTANISTSGTVRLARTDTIGWRNQANGGNLLLSVNASDQLLFNGSAVNPVSAGGDVVVTTAGAGVIVKTPDGLHTYRLAIDNNGEFTTEQIS